MSWSIPGSSLSSPYLSGQRQTDMSWARILISVTIPTTEANSEQGLEDPGKAKSILQIPASGSQPRPHMRTTWLGERMVTKL